MAEGEEVLWWLPRHSRTFPVSPGLLHVANNILGSDKSLIVLASEEPRHTNAAATATATAAAAAAPTGNSGNNDGDKSKLVGKSTGFVFSKGLGFAGQVFGLYSSSRNCLVGVEERRSSRNFPVPCSFLKRFLSKLLSVEPCYKAPKFQFYINRDDANAYLSRLKVADMEIGSVPLHLAYKFFKERPALFTFIPSKKQVQLAKTLIKREQGGKAAQQFQGVPVFSSQNLSILVVSPSGARWFRPHFFRKEELDGVIKSSMEHHYQSLIRSRRARRHNQVSDFPSDMGEDDVEMLESQEMQDFMEDMDEWGSILESMMAKAAQMYFQDTLDRAIFGNKWCRMLAGIQPRFPVLVDSFEQRVTSETENVVVNRSEQGRSLKRNGWLEKLGFDSSVQPSHEYADEELSAHTPHLTVVVGIAGSSTEQVVRAASSAIQEAKDKIEKNEMSLENLFIADLGGPNIWSNPSSGLSGLGGSSDEPPSSGLRA